MGFVPLACGEIRINNQLLSPATINKIRQEISYLPQELSLDLDTVGDLIYYPFEFKNNRHLKPDKHKINEVLKLLLLDESILSKKLSEVSGGQKQRLGLASVVLLNKPIMILDEPTSALDDDSAVAVAKLIGSFKKTTVISASHDLRWIELMDTQIKL